MRELRREPSFTPRGGQEAAPVLLSQAPAEALRLAHLLRLGFDDDAMDALDLFLDQIGSALGEVVRRTDGRAPREPQPPVQEVLKALQDASLCQARGDLIGLADVLEHRVAEALRTA